MNVSNLAMVFAPSILRSPPNEDPKIILSTQKFHQTFVLHLIGHLKCD